jgi:2-keto-4-pentenoate hydratase/2-oxohepta-3-ene-1,7-dioic acid hydratase in catechol pathway
MKLITFEAAGGQRIGALDADGRVIVLADEAQRQRSPHRAWFDDMLSLVRAGRGALEHVHDLVASADHSRTLDVAAVRRLAPLPRPEQVRCFAAFEEHGVRSSAAMLKIMASRAPDPAKAEQELRASGRFNIPKMWYERPLYYKGNRFSVVGTETPIVWPKYSQVVDFELELACVLGLQGKDIPRERAHEHIFGYMVCNDLSARDAQSIEMQAPLGPAKGKDFDGGLPMGPCLVTADEFDRGAAVMIVRVNGEEWSRGHARDMHHSFEDMIRYVSDSETLHPGEVFLSGCMGGGSGMELGRYAQRGDTIELEIAGIGVLSNRIV